MTSPVVPPIASWSLLPSESDHLCKTSEPELDFGPLFFTHPNPTHEWPIMEVKEKLELVQFRIWIRPSFIQSGIHCKHKIVTQNWQYTNGSKKTSALTIGLETLVSPAIGHWSTCPSTSNRLIILVTSELHMHCQGHLNFSRSSN